MTSKPDRALLYGRRFSTQTLKSSPTSCFTFKDEIPAQLQTGKKWYMKPRRNKEVIFLHIYIYTVLTPTPTSNEKIRKIRFESGSWHWHKEDSLILVEYSSVTPLQALLVDALGETSWYDKSPHHVKVEFIYGETVKKYC